MKKKNFITLILATIGGILFALGMCMCLLPEWNAFTPGVVMAAVGIVVLLIMLMVRRKMEGKSVIVKLSAKTVRNSDPWNCRRYCSWNRHVHDYGMGHDGSGVLVGIVGIVLLLCLIPVIKGIK